MSLPWDRFGDPAGPGMLPPPPPALPPAPVPEPVPVLPQQPVPVPPPVDIGAALDNALEDLWPMLKQQALDYARTTAGALAAGKQVDHAHPKVTATTATGRQLVVADAKSRSARTLVQGLIFDLFAGLVAVVATLSGADPFVGATWVAFGVLLLKTLASAGISYVMRLKVTPTMKTEGTKLAIMPVPRPILAEEKGSP